MTDVDSKLARGKVIKAINIFNNLKSNILLENNVFIPELINRFINKE